MGLIYHFNSGTAMKAPASFDQEHHGQRFCVTLVPIFIDLFKTGI